MNFIFLAIVVNLLCFSHNVCLSVLISKFNDFDVYIGTYKSFFNELKTKMCNFVPEMRILLLGEYSNVHWNLALGLRALGHEVCVVSDGDNWKNYQRDIDLRRKSVSPTDTLRYLCDLLVTFPKFKNFDVVQIINPVFLSLKADKIRPFYNYLRKHNKKVFLGAFGMDYYYIKSCLDCKTFRYSDFNIGTKIRQASFNDIWLQDWYYGSKGKLNQYIAHDCDGIITGLYEYDCAYQPEFKEKTCFIPFPIDTSVVPRKLQKHEKVRFFIGIQKQRSAYKGTDIMLEALENARRDFPDKIEIVKVESVPFSEYKQLLSGSDIILDQLYAYTPAMNALTAMAQGLVVMGGGEPEAYDLLGDHELRPVVNVLPDKQSVYDAVVELATHPECIPDLSRRGVEYVHRFHDYKKVAERYVRFYCSR